MSRARSRALGRPSSVVLVVLAALAAGMLATPSGSAAPRTPATPVTSVTSVTSVALAPTAATASRPDVLVIETDDMRLDDLRFMPRTRALIEARGLSFANSFSPSPLCCPARASFLTGRYSHNHGVYTHDAPYGFASFDDRSTLATTLRRVGYRTAMVGKYLNGYGYQRLRSPHHARPGASSRTYVPPGWTRWLGALDSGIDPLARGGGANGGTYRYNKLAQNVDGTPRSFRGYSADVMGKQVRDLEKGFRRSAAPWFLWWTPVAPHHGLPGEADDPKPVRGADGTVQRFKTPARPKWARGAFDKVVPRAPGVRADGTTESDVSDKPAWMRGPELNAAERSALREVTRQRGESLLALDRQIGRTLDQLYATARGRRALVVFTSDNGYYLGEHRVRQGKRTLHEPSLRVPLLIAGGGVPRGVRYDPASTVDLGPTIAEYAGTTLPRADGRSLRSTITSGDRGWDRPVITETQMAMTRAAGSDLPPTPLTVRGLRLGGWSLTRYATGETELYDMLQDPLQLENRAQDPAYAEQRDALVALMHSYRDCAGAACSAPLPPELRLTPAQARAAVQRQDQLRRAYYG